MKVYVKNGARLGWLLDRKNRKVEISRQGSDVEILDSPVTMSGEDVLPGLVLDLSDTALPAIMKHSFTRIPFLS